MQQFDPFIKGQIFGDLLPVANWGSGKFGRFHLVVLSSVNLLFLPALAALGGDRVNISAGQPRLLHC